MKKNILKQVGVLTVMAVATTVTGCSGGKEEAKATAAETVTETVTEAEVTAEEKEDKGESGTVLEGEETTLVAGKYSARYGCRKFAALCM